MAALRPFNITINFGLMSYLWMHAILLGRPWWYDRNMQDDGRERTSYLLFLMTLNMFWLNREKGEFLLSPKKFEVCKEKSFVNALIARSKENEKSKMLANSSSNSRLLHLKSSQRSFNQHVTSKLNWLGVGWQSKHPSI